MEKPLVAKNTPALTPLQPNFKPHVTCDRLYVLQSITSMLPDSHQSDPLNFLAFIRAALLLEGGKGSKGKQEGRSLKEAVQKLFRLFRAFQGYTLTEMVVVVATTGVLTVIQGRVL